jgi:DNA-binding NtrC family response regulator
MKYARSATNISNTAIAIHRSMIGRMTEALVWEMFGRSGAIAEDRNGGGSTEIDEMREYLDIMEALKMTRGNKRKAALLLGMPRSTMRSKLQRFERRVSDRF